MSFATAAARRVHQRIRLARIEALGDYRGQWTFCDRVPAYITAIGGDVAATYKPWFKADEGPRQVSSEVHPFGGVEEAGELALAIVDGVGARAGGDRDALTARLRTDALPDLELDVDVDRVDDTAILVSGPDTVIAGLTEKTVLFLGVEAWAVTAVNVLSGTQAELDVTRAFLATEATPHDAGSSVYLYPPFMEGRRVRLFYTFDDPGLTRADETEVGSGWRIEDDELDESLGAYVLSCLSSQGPIDRLLASKAYSGTVLRVGAGSLPNVKLRLDPEVQRWADEAPHFGDGIWLQHGDEVVFASQLALDHWSVLARGCVRTTEATFDADEDVRQVFVAYGGPVAGITTGRSSFRFQVRGTETASRGTGTWIGDERAEHPIPAILCALTSSSTPDGSDGLGGVNYVAGKGNYSVLPMGVGAGIPASEIDFDSFLALWDRFPEWRATGLVLSKSITAREFCSTLAMLFGFTITMRAGKLRADIATIPTAGTSTAISWGLDEILTEEVDAGLERSRIAVRRATDLSAKVLKYKTTRPGGYEHDVIIRDADFPLLAGHIRSRYTGETAPAEIDAHAIWADSAGGARTLYERAMRLFFYIRRPPIEVRLFTDLRYVADVFISQFALLTHPDLTDRTRGVRGVENGIAWIVKKAIDEEHDEIEWTVLLLGTGGKFGRVSPAARITGVVGTTATCRANRYTDPANALGLPTSDVAAFAIGDVCVLAYPDGKRVSVAPETVVAISANTIQFSGTFGGTLASGLIVRAALWDDEAASQRTQFVSYADAVTQGLGSGEDSAFTYGER